MNAQSSNFPMPEGVEDMTKQELWDWFSRSTQASFDRNVQMRRYFSAISGLHDCLARNDLPSPHETIELQRRKIDGLKTQMQQMHKGYRRKIRRLELLLEASTPPRRAGDA